MDLLELQEQAIVQEMPEIQVGVSTFVETTALPSFQGPVQQRTAEPAEVRVGRLASSSASLYSLDSAGDMFSHLFPLTKSRHRP